MRIKNILKYILISWLIIGFFGFLQGPVCDAEPSLNQRLHQTNKQRNIVKQKKQQTDIKLKKEKNKLSNNQQRLEAAHAQLQENTVRYNHLVTNLSSMEAQLSTAVREFQRIDKEMRVRINDVYKHQRRGMFEMILSAKDVNSLLDTLYFEKIIIQINYRKMQQMKSKANEIARLKGQVEKQKRMIETSIRTIKTQRITIQNSIQANKTMIERLQKDKIYYEKTEKELARQSANLQNMIANLSKSNAKKQTSQVIVSSTKFIKPISGPITSPFGYRIHPIFKSRIYHSGIDIGGPNRGAIKASNDGRVIFAGWYGGYGKVVILDHGIINGKPITTLYGHMSQIKVSNGQNVKKGQTIGLEGSTGYSTGPHCHFEVRVNGKPTNPMNYI